MTAVAPCVLGISVVVLRTGALGRRVGHLGAPCSAAMLVGVVVELGTDTTPLTSSGRSA